MLSCFPFMSCTSVSNLVTLSCRILMSSFFRVVTWSQGRSHSNALPSTEGERQGCSSKGPEAAWKGPFPETLWVTVWGQGGLRP